MTEVAPLRDASTLTDEERHLIASFEPAVAALSTLFGPGCEVVLHAFDSLHASVIKIANGHITGRQAGAPVTDFALDKLHSAAGSQWSSYFSRSREGTLLKSSSITISNREGKPIGMLCVNFSLDTPLGSLLDTFAPPAVPPAHGTETFASSVDDLVAQVIAKVDRDPGLGSSVRNKAIVHRLYDMGIFEIKDAAQLVAELLGISRHTVYLHIRNHKAELAEQQ
ncbi:helix-turn-helix transcriptional regulator [Aeromonas caviae]|uniref:helix-turn-helix transcriptional regulator n=1 Tax=Aeromonas caviae TaxID=648 RepID=UPI002B4986A4|nr:PAS domain-containing protein [Aeromonas caviae]